MPREYRHISQYGTSYTEKSIQLVRCAGFSEYPEADIMDMYPVWIFLHGSCRFKRKYKNVKMNAVKPTGMTEYIYGSKETVFTVTTENVCISIYLFLQPSVHPTKNKTDSTRIVKSVC